MKKLVKKIFLILVFLLLNGVLLYSANAETQNINVQLIVPSSGGGGGGDVTPPPVVDATPPTISGVVSSTTHTTALISWTASDNVGISSVAFAYGTSLSYGLTASPAGSYSVNLSGLATGTIYYYKITAVDASSNSVNFTGSFKTTEASIVLDVTPPLIANVVSSTTYTTASINWSASDNKAISATTFVYGTTISYGQTSIPGGSYVVNLSGLATNTIYYFKITAIDTSNNQSTFTGSFKTPIYTSVVSGPIISNISAVPGVNSAVITFNTDKNSTAQINYGSTVSLGSNASQGQTLQTSHTLSLFDLSPNKTYYYQIIATDADLISTSTIILNFKTLPDIIAPPNVSNLQLITGLNSFTLNWNNPSLSFAPDFSGVKILRKINVQASGPNDNSASVVYSGNGETVKDSQALPGFTYFYTVYSYDASNNFSSGNFVQGKILVVVSEICNNSIDNNSDGKTDCADSTCSNSSNCKKVDEVLNNTAGAMVACSDTKDNDNDGMIDFPTDIGCSSSQDSDEYNPPTSTVPEFEKLTLNKLKFFAGSRQIELTPQGKTIIGLANSNLSVGIKKSALIGDPKNLILRIGDIDQHQFNFDSSNNTYYADVLFPQNGTSQAFIEINYGANQIDSLGIDLQSVAMGQIMDDKKDGLIGAEVTLHSENGGDFTASVFGQKNPQITNFNSLVGWMVPNGRYYITVKKDKFYDYSGPFFNVSNNIINNSVNLVAIPPKIQDVIDPKATVAKNVANVANNIAQKTSVAAAVAVQQVENAVVAVQEIASDPEVQKVARTVVAPTAVGVAAVSSVALASWADIIPLLRFLFLQPLLVLGRGKREKWGMVYNSLSKLPVDLALVRLFNMDTGKLVQTKVTSSDGKYFFTVNAGRYRLEVRKGAFVFPTIILKGFEMDGKRVDIYHGEAIKVVEKGSVITANIPLDPAGEKLKTPFRLIFGKMIARLFDSKFNKLVATEVTGPDGKYYFMAGDNQYYISYDRDGYNSLKTEIIDLKGKDFETNSQDIKLKKK